MVDIAHIVKWLDSRNSAYSNEVKIVPLSELDKWSIANGKISHESGHFFMIEGLEIQTNYGSISKWDQPIINQPEMGLLGIISRLNSGTREYLMQAKMEPGNINTTQISPTVQATKSNYTRVHKGDKNPFIDYFIGLGKPKVLVDRIQYEHGGRFLYKVNRNMIVEIDDDVEINEDFYWINDEEMHRLLSIDNMVNMDSRSVLSCYLTNKELEKQQGNISHPLYSDNEILNWFTALKARYYTRTRQIPLESLAYWEVSENQISNIDGMFFSVIGVQVQAQNREVSSWSQPIFREEKLGMIGFIIKVVYGVEYYLVQAISEPGRRSVALTTTVQCSDYMDKVDAKGIRPCYIDYFLKDNPNTGNVLYDKIQSEEGGRFYHFQNRNMIVEVDDVEVDVNYIWMSYDQVVDFIDHGHFNIEARTLMACWKCGSRREMEHV